MINSRTETEIYKISPEHKVKKKEQNTNWGMSKDIGGNWKGVTIEKRDRWVIQINISTDNLYLVVSALDGMGWDGMGWDGMGWDGKGTALYSSGPPPHCQ